MAFSKLSGKGIDLSSNVLTSFASTGIDDNATSTAITIDSSERVGINITPTTRSLEVKSIANQQIIASFKTGSGITGRLSIMDNNTTADNSVGIGSTGNNLDFYAGAAAKATLSATGNLSLIGNLTSRGIDDNATSTALTLDSSGNLGIGDTSPDAGLTVHNNAGAVIATSDIARQTYTSVGNLQVSTAGAGGILIHSGASSAGYLTFGDGGIAGRILYDHTSNFMAFTTGGIAERMRIDSSGRVGIGKTPSCALHVATNAYLKVLVEDVEGADSPFSIGSGVNGFTISNNAGANTADEAITLNSNTQSIIFFTAGAERTRINSSGNVGIGSQGSNSIRLLVTGSHSDSTNHAIEARDSSSNVLFNVRNDGLMILGLRTNSPYNFTTSNSANAYLNSSGGLQRSTSSRRYKTDITDMTYGLSDVMNLRPVTFEGINDPDGQRFGGFIAEEVHDVGLAEFVDYNDEDQPDALAYGNMVALLAKAVQEQQALIETLQTEVAELKAGD